jgi:hypothetical protein
LTESSQVLRTTIAAKNILAYPSMSSTSEVANHIREFKRTVDAAATGVAGSGATSIFAALSAVAAAFVHPDTHAAFLQSHYAQFVGTYWLISLLHWASLEIRVARPITRASARLLYLRGLGFWKLTH